MDRTGAEVMRRVAGRRLVLLVVLALGLVLGLSLRAFVARPFTVGSDSMNPTLCQGDRIVVSLWNAGTSRLDRGDLVLLRTTGAGTPVVKRAVGLPGDTVEIRDAELFVNDRHVRESYVDHASIDALYYGPVQVPDRAVLVLGDDRARSVDSRDYGPVPAEHLVGKVWWRLTSSC